MKVGGSPLKIWEGTANQLRAVDIGSSFDPRFRDERVPTLAEALAACKGVSRVDIELKDYGHSDRLEERVVEIVEAAGMEKQIVTMSLSRDMVAKMKRLRPGWTSGLLSAKAVGDLSGVPADFLAVEKAMATRRFLRAAHHAGKPVYVWTVDDPARMTRMIGLGVDGVITNRPDVAREVLDRYARMSQAGRLFLFVMTTLGAETDVVPPGNELRP
jgi:glycerophosphoryl diester phosphodiesterase